MPGFPYIDDEIALADLYALVGGTNFDSDEHISDQAGAGSRALARAARNGGNDNETVCSVIRPASSAPPTITVPVTEWNIRICSVRPGPPSSRMI